MKKILGGILLALAPSAFAVEQTVEIKPETELLSVNVLYGYQTGCSPIVIDLDVRYSSQDQMWVIEKTPDPAQAMLAELEKKLKPETMTEVRKALFPGFDGFPGGISICQAEMPVYGQVYFAVNGKYNSEVTFKVAETGFEPYGEPEVTVKQLTSL